jgi:(R,R)-butanediol dehydrogenase/meso-butanediol dehydrogenase/diacetyl reductase
LIIGGGTIGIAVLKWARFFGAVDVAVSEIVPARMERAKKAGATLVVDASKNDNPVQTVRKETGRQPMYIFECVGRPILQKLINTAENKSHIIVLGGSMASEEISSVSAVLKNLKMTFSFGYEVPKDLQFTLQMMAEGRITVDPLITGTVGLEGLQQMFDEILQKPNDHCKVLFTP